MFQKLLRKIANELHKIVAGRGRDIEDVRAILLKNPNYNARYIEGWLKEFDKLLNEKFSAVFHEIEKGIKSL